LISGIIRGQGTKSINALDGADRRLIQGGHAARLLHLHIRRTSVALNIEGDIDPLRLGDARVAFILQPVFRNFRLHHAYVPGLTSAEVATAAGKAEASFGSARAEHSIGSAHWPALAEGHNVIRFFHGFRLWLSLARAGLIFRLRLCALVGDWIGFRFLFFLVRIW